MHFTDFDVKVSAHFYPPIGGYAAYELREQNHEYYLDLKTWGEFEVFIQAFDNKGNELPTSEYEYTYTIAKTSDPDGILTKIPTQDEVTGEILGAVGDKTGSAVLTITVVITSKTDSSKTYTYSRNLYINRVH